jgi:hypothetical protein
VETWGRSTSVTLGIDANWQQKNSSGEDGFQQRVKGVESDQNPLNSSENERESQAGAAKASVSRSLPVPADADLAEIVEAWPALPEALRAGILAMIKAALRGGKR